jgi:rare lipoprotein A (peptidoglycan hydrolase)
MRIVVRNLSPLCVVMPLAFAGWLQSSGEVRGCDTPQSVAAVAARVEKKAERSEKKEGKRDLVKDSVRTKTDPEGEAVVEQVGEASFYGKGFHGKETANGGRFDQRDLTAAHPALPLGTEAKVTNLETGESVQVRINDRGPYAKGRDIDLSKAAAAEVGLTNKKGEAPVKIEAAVPPEGEQAVAPCPRR